MYGPNFQSVEVDSECSFGLGLRTPNLGEVETVEGRRWYHSKERWRVPIGPLYSNFSITRFRDIAASVLQYATFSYPTSSLPKISPCSPGIRWMAFGLRKAKVLG